jgi:hypothetical protein
MRGIRRHIDKRCQDKKTIFLRLLKDPVFIFICNYLQANRGSRASAPRNKVLARRGKQTGHPVVLMLQASFARGKTNQNPQLLLCYNPLAYSSRGAIV